MKAAYCKYRLNFYQKAITSREIMDYKDTYFIKIWDENKPDLYGVGECALFKGLSAEDCENYEDTLANVCKNIDNVNISDLGNLSSIKFGIETALNDLMHGGRRTIFSTDWQKGLFDIHINGLIWMGTFDQMYNRINEKLKLGFKCLKLKIGGIDFDKELELIKYIRSYFSSYLTNSYNLCCFASFSV